jgi:nucleoside-diphosphate-sugar epimerase
MPREAAGFALAPANGRRLMHVFVTGASGFVGGAAVKRLVADGHKVSAMSRSEISDAKIRALGAEPVRCDLDTIKPDHVQGVDVAIHSAAFVKAWGPKDAWFKANVLGTQAVLDACAAAGVKRFIHIGTEAAILKGQHIRNADETYPLAPDSPYPYCGTKAQAEQRVRDANRPGVFETIVLRPRLIWGPGDTTLLPLVEAMAASGKWRWIDHGKAMTSTIHIDNLVHAICLALTKGRPGEAYFIIDDGTISMKDMIAGMAASRQLILADRSIPSWLADMVAAVGETVWRMFGLQGRPPLMRLAAMVMSRDCMLNGAKARAELGYHPVITVKDGLAALAQTA